MSASCSRSLFYACNGWLREGPGQTVPREDKGGPVAGERLLAFAIQLRTVFAERFPACSSLAIVRRDFAAWPASVVVVVVVLFFRVPRCYLGHFVYFLSPIEFSACAARQLCARQLCLVTHCGLVFVRRSPDGKTHQGHDSH